MKPFGSQCARRPGGPGTFGFNRFVWGWAAMDNRKGLVWSAVAVWLLLLASGVPLLGVLQAPIHGDVRLYHQVAKEVCAGQMPYRHRHLEYPPYAVGLFLLPRACATAEPDYQQAFAALVLLADALIKYLLLTKGFEQARGLSRFLPLALYALTVPFIRYFYLQRFDIFPAAVTLAAVIAGARGWWGWAGAWVAVGAGLKLYPALLSPVLWVVAWRQGAGKRFAGGATLGLAPLGLLSFVLPWWRFLAFHGERGLQVESLYASVVWLVHRLAGVPAGWVQVKAWTEVQGPLAQALVPWAKGLMLVATLSSVAFGCWVAAQVRAWNLPRLARLALVPLVPFVALNIVFSPQYMIWLLPSACLGMLEGRKWPMLWIALSTAVVPVWYPSPQFVTGFSLAQTLVLLGRNVGLVVVWLVLVWDWWQLARQPSAVEPGAEPLASAQPPQPQVS